MGTNANMVSRGTSTSPENVLFTSEIDTSALAEPLESVDEHEDRMEDIHLENTLNSLRQEESGESDKYTDLEPSGYHSSD